ncbi:MAG TPA: hypothetical protein DEP24_05080, partial [Mycobacterium sp.]|nr:hypothetical protein [Mycobacterium sp.]
TITLDGKGEPGSTITIYDNGKPIGTAQVDANGNWSFITPPLPDGPHSFSAAQTDPNGNTGPASEPINLVVDTTPPAAPGVISVSQDTGVNGDRVTTDNTLTVTGTAEPGSTVKIYDLVNGKLVLVGEGIADANGRYTITTVPLADGQHPLTISATDASGNESGLTQLGTWTIDTTAPAAPVITGYGQDTGTSPDSFTEDTDLFLVGTAEPNSVVEVFDGDRLLGVATTDALGKWRLDSTGLLDRSTHSFTARATDTAGNVGPRSNALDVTITVPLAASGSQFMAFTVARPESHPVMVTGGTGPMSYQLVPGKGDLPEGLSLNPATGVISGVPVRLSMGTVQVLVTDRYGHTVPVTVSIKVEAADKPLLVSSGIGTTTNVGQIPRGLVNPMTYESGTAVTLYDTADFKPSGQAVPFVGYNGDVRVALDDIDANGVPDIVAGAGAGAQPHVRVLDIETGVSKMSFLAFDAAYRGGLFVSTGDINSDNYKDIVVASGIGTRSHIKVFDGKTGAEIASFYAFEEVAQSTELLHFRDTDGDGIADERRIVLSGFGTEDSHHNLHTLRWGPDGRLYLNQSVYTRTDTETPHGVVRLKAGGIFRLDTRDQRMDILFRGLINGWGHQFDAFGQSFLTDGAGSEGISWGIPGATYRTLAPARRQLESVSPGRYPKFSGIELIRSAQFPTDWQGDVITLDFRAHRVVRFKLTDQGSGYITREMPDVMRSTTDSFRPVDARLGPDGALYIADWSNPIIQHGEVDFRDPRRDKAHGRIWRVTVKGGAAPRARTDLALLPNPALLELLVTGDSYQQAQSRRVLIERGAAAVRGDLDVWMRQQTAEA